MPDASSTTARRAATARAPRSAPPRPRRGRAIAIAIGSSIAGLLVLGLAAYFAVPPIATNLSTDIVATDTPIATGDGAVTVTVPAGWSVQHPFLEDDALILRSPDGHLALTLAASPLAADAAFAALAASFSGVGAPVTETLGSGLSLVHAQADGGRTVLAAVGSGEAGATVIAHIDAETPAAYQPAIAEVLESIGLRA